MNLKKLFLLIAFTLIIACTFSSGSKTVAGDIGGKEETALDVVIDTTQLTGINLWIAEMYNNDRLLYAIVVTLVMAALGSIMAFGTDLVLKYFGTIILRGAQINHFSRYAFSK